MICFIFLRIMLILITRILLIRKLKRILNLNVSVLFGLGWCRSTRCSSGVRRVAPGLGRLKHSETETSQTETVSVSLVSRFSDAQTGSPRRIVKQQIPKHPKRKQSETETVSVPKDSETANPETYETETK